MLKGNIRCIQQNVGLVPEGACGGGEGRGVGWGGGESHHDRGHGSQPPPGAAASSLLPVVSGCL